MTDKQKEEWRMNMIMLLASAKLMSDQSTYLQGELHRDLKHEYNVMVNSTDRFIKTVERLLGENNHTLQEITDALNNKMTDLRKEINNIAS